MFGENLHTIYSGGAYLNPKLIEQFKEYGIALVQGYGMTEFSPRISANTKTYSKLGSVGHLIPGCEAKIEDGFVFITGRKKNLIILANGENVSPEELENKFSGWLLAKELMVYSDNNVITFEVFPNADVVAAMQIPDVEAVVKAKVAEINNDLPLYKRINKVIIRETEFEKTGSGKIKRKY
ncbi:MAG: AMP-binding protein [Acutalibacteraceae bacterium]